MVNNNEAWTSLGPYLRSEPWLIVNYR
uniref:Uncharacterized protein n=1 Tax=Anguilla anguilla TaxID=7936 RepID=A0A0E9UUE1_ANGAN